MQSDLLLAKIEWKGLQKNRLSLFLMCDEPSLSSTVSEDCYLFIIDIPVLLLGDLWGSCDGLGLL